MPVLRMGGIEHGKCQDLFAVFFLPLDPVAVHRRGVSARIDLDVQGFQSQVREIRFVLSSDGRFFLQCEFVTDCKGFGGYELRLLTWSFFTLRVLRFNRWLGFKQIIHPEVLVVAGSGSGCRHRPS